ncbi:hypothetical protein WME79_45540 [Sorangium sp. So ce726]|uniref:hypothetical protein n=1 Tax=Sorangium sp. So ce726 TaxID=3133319 RepID=UPI003F612782
MRESADGSGVQAEVGEARAALCQGQAIVNVVALPGTYYWADDAHLLTSAEGFGPRALQVAVATSVEASVSIETSVTPNIPEVPSSTNLEPSSRTLGSRAPTGFLPPLGIPGGGIPWGPQPSSGTPGGNAIWGSQPFPGMPGSGTPWSNRPNPMFGGGNGNGSSGSEPSSGTAGDDDAPWDTDPSGVLGGCTPSIKEISEAVGFDVGESVDLEASTTFLVPTGAYARVSAYPVFHKFTWDIVGVVGSAWGGGPISVIIATGSALRPTGIYFDTYRAFDFAAIGGGVVSPGPIWDPGEGGGGAGGAGGTGGTGGTGGAGGAGGAGGEGGAGGGQGWFIDPGDQSSPGGQGGAGGS